MLGSLLSLRPAERRPAWIAFAFLTTLMASHTLLETARDALFLARLPARHLPFMYLAIAGLSLALSRAESRLVRFLPQRAAMMFWTGLAAAGTLGFWALVSARRGRGQGHPDEWAAVGLYGLYIWTGVIAALVLLHFWSLVAEAVSVTQAKRLYPLIGSGSVLGALAGSGLASGLSRMLGAEPLLLAAAVGFGASTFVAMLLLRFGFGAGANAGLGGPVPQADPVLDMQLRAAGSGGPDAALTRDARLAARMPYVRRVTLLVLASAACLTVLDYAFKSAVAASVPAAELGTFFGGVALGLNLLSLVCQLALAPYLLKRFDLRVTLGTLPLLILIAGTGVLFGLGLVAALFGKAADGALRYSLHRTATELLYVPLPDRARPRIKAVVDVVGQRFGQALASLLILALALLGVGPLPLAIVLCALALLWFGSALGLRRHYVALLRSQLREGDVPHGQAFPELDLASLETLVAALDSRNDHEVLAALDVLEREQKSRLIPALILHHPSEAVVLRALGSFARARRTDVVHVIDRLFDHPAIRVRCDAIAARSLLAPDPRMLYARMSHEDSPEVRATVVVHLIASGEIAGAEARERLEHLLESGLPSTRAALATAIAWRTDHAFDEVLVQLAAATELEVRLAAIGAMAQSPAPLFVPALIRLLGSERTRSPARRALLAHGKDGLAATRAALGDRSLPAAVRWELPRTLSYFEPGVAIEALLFELTKEPDGMVRYRIIRALEALVSKHPSISLERRILERVIRETVTRAYRHLDERVSLERGALAVPARRTPGHGLLVNVLQAKERNTIERLLRLLGLAHPAADFASIRQSLRSSSAKTRANGVELIGNVLESPLRPAVLGLVEEQPDPQRLAAAGTFYRPANVDYEALLERMLERESPAVQDFTAYHIAELGLSQFRPLIAALANTDPSRGDLIRALGRLDPELRGEPELAPC